MRVFLLLITLLVSQPAFAQSSFDKMTNSKMNKILLRESSEVKGEDGNWQAIYKEKMVMVLTSEDHNRMRIISPILKTSEIEAAEYEILLEANFDKALDAKYAIYDGVLWASFTHPLGELTYNQFKDALDQIINLVNNYGTSYTSTHLVFGQGSDREE